jgi:hypothetical protein
MSSSRLGPHNLQGLPTLTEVIEMPAAAYDAGADETLLPLEASPVPDDVVQAVVAGPIAAPAISEEQLVQRVLIDLQRHADLMLEYRLREALTPALARLTDSLIRDLRQELAATLRDVVARAVSQELARRQGR